MFGESLFWKTLGRAKVSGLLKSVGYKRTIAVALFIGVALLRVLGHTEAAQWAENVGGWVGMTPAQVGAGASPVDVVALITGVVGVVHWLSDSVSKDKADKG